MPICLRPRFESLNTLNLPAGHPVMVLGIVDQRLNSIFLNHSTDPDQRVAEFLSRMAFHTDGGICQYIGKLEVKNWHYTREALGGITVHCSSHDFQCGGVCSWGSLRLVIPTEWPNYVLVVVEPTAHAQLEVYVLRYSRGTKLSTTKEN